MKKTHQDTEGDNENPGTLHDDVVHYMGFACINAWWQTTIVYKFRDHCQSTGSAARTVQTCKVEGGH